MNKQTNEMKATTLINILKKMPPDKEVYIQTTGEPEYVKAYNIKEKILIDFDSELGDAISVIVIDYAG